jgi:hypothetical protein
MFYITVGCFRRRGPLVRHVGAKGKSRGITSRKRINHIHFLHTADVGILLVGLAMLQTLLIRAVRDIIF